MLANIAVSYALPWSLKVRVSSTLCLICACDQGTVLGSEKRGYFTDWGDKLNGCTISMTWRGMRERFPECGGDIKYKIVRVHSRKLEKYWQYSGKKSASECDFEGWIGACPGGQTETPVSEMRCFQEIGRMKLLSRQLRTASFKTWVPLAFH